MGRIACAILSIFLCASPLLAETLRVATFNAALSRHGPGLLVQALLKDDDPQVASVVAILSEIRPDIVLITDFDYDYNGIAAGLFRKILNQNGLDYPYFYAGPVNSGVASGQDLDGDGKTTGWADSFGFGQFPGQGGMLLFSAYPIKTDAIRSFRKILWPNLPGAILPKKRNGSAFYSTDALAVLRLSSKSHWDVPVQLPDGQVLHVLSSHSAPPVFDGPENRNGLRNSDEILFWAHYLDGTEITDDAWNSAARDDTPFVILGDLNADPYDGEGGHRAVTTLLSHPLVQDAMPASTGAVEAATTQKGANRNHKGPTELDTADWNDENGPGNLRVDYVLPSHDLNVSDAGVFWPETTNPLRSLIEPEAKKSTRHRLVWVDIEF